MACFCQLHAEHTLRVGVSEGVPELMDIYDGHLAGSLATTYGCVFESTRYQVEYVSVPLKRGLYYLEKGQLDVLIPLARNPQRDQKLIFGGELIRSEYSYISTEPFDEILERETARFAIVRGFVGSVFIPDSAYHVYEVTRWSQLVPMLTRGRADASIIPTKIAGQVLGDLIDQLHVKPAGVLDASLYISPVHGLSEIKERIQGSVQKCRLQMQTSQES